MRDVNSVQPRSVEKVEPSARGECPSATDHGRTGIQAPDERCAPEAVQMEPQSAAARWFPLAARGARQGALGARSLHSSVSTAARRTRSDTLRESKRQGSPNGESASNSWRSIEQTLGACETFFALYALPIALPLRTSGDSLAPKPARMLRISGNLRSSAVADGSRSTHAQPLSLNRMLGKRLSTMDGRPLAIESGARCAPSARA